jgi:acetoin utilization deacetylase AcuC-like enzyme
MTDRLRALADAADAPIGFVLEGGYGLDVLAEGVAMVHETFDGRDPIPTDEDVDDDVRDLLDEARDLHGLDD